MVQTRSIASVNPEFVNPPTAIEVQLQMHLATIERLTQSNEALVQQNQALGVRVKQLRK